MTTIAKGRRSQRRAQLTAWIGILGLATAAHVARGAPPGEIRVYTLDCGRIDVRDMDMFADDGSYAGVHGELADPCYLIRHPKGDLLWDAGVGDQFYGPNGVTFIPGIITAHVPVKLETQLRKLGVSVASIRYLAFSHEHVDHIGNANLLTNATWLLNHREHAWTIIQEGQNGVPPAPLANAQSVHIRWIDGDYDVFGDGSVEIIQAPGHTPGHQVLLVRPTGLQPLILAGDLWHSRANYDHDRVPRINFNRAATLASMRKVRRIAQEVGARIIIQHAPEDFHLGDAKGWDRPSP